MADFQESVHLKSGIVSSWPFPLKHPATEEPFLFYISIFNVLLHKTVPVYLFTFTVYLYTERWDS